jgi:hypothetical protein
MEKEQAVKPKSPGGFVRCLSGLFITKDNPGGLTPAELTVTAALFAILKSKNLEIIDKDVRLELANLNNFSFQVAVNYVNKLKSKGVVTADNRLHPIFFKEKITIEWKE